MIFYLAALQSMSPQLAEAAAIEGASRWYFFRRVTFPLLMPTTLFVLVNAVINAFRLVDHIVVMTRGGPDNATVAAALLHLRDRLPLLGLGVRGGADRWCCWCMLGLVALAQFVLPRAQGALPMTHARRTHARRRAARARNRRRLAARRCCGSCRSPTRSGRRSIRPNSRRASCSPRRSRSTTSSRPGTRRRSRATSSTRSCWCTMVLAAQLVLVHARRLRVRALRVSRAQRAVRAGAGAADDHARRADRRELPHDDARSACKDTILAIGAAVHGERVRHLPAAPDVQDGAARARRGGARRRLHAAAGAVEGVRAARAADVPRLRAGQRELSLEQLPVAADHHQLGRVAAGDGGPAGVLGRPTRASTGRSSPRRRC